MSHNTELAWCSFSMYTADLSMPSNSYVSEVSIVKSQLFKSPILLFAIVFFPPLQLSAAELAIDTSNGVAIKQVTYATNTPQISDTGVLDIDLIRLRESTAQQSGYINMSIGSDWVVRNLKVDEESTFPYSHIAVEFDIGSSETVSELSDVTISYADEVAVNFSPVVSTAISLDVATTNYSIGGIPGAPVVAPPSPPNMTDILFGDPTNTDAITQFDHPNIEAAVNQCMPASIANSLQYLVDTTDLMLPHANVQGLKGDDSLVGQLDTATDRTVVNRRSDANSGTWGIEGKLKYLAENGLQDRVKTTHMGSGANAGSDDVSVTVDGTTASATGLGDLISFDTLLTSMKEGQDCELVYAWPGGAHAVDAVAAGVTNGQPWIVHGSDLDQDTDSEGAGASGFQFEYLKDTDGDGQLNLSGGNEELVQVICEKYIPPPVETSVTQIDDPAGHSCCVTPPPSMLSVIVDGTGPTITVSGNAPWLPFTGMLADDGSVDIRSTATVAGFSNVESKLTGVFNPVTNLIDNVQISLGSNGALPQGLPITYNVDLISGGPAPTVNLIVRANGFRDELLIASNDLLSLTLELNAATNVGDDADWWVIADSPSGFKSFNIATFAFEDGIFSTFQGPLIDVPFTRVKLFDGLESGTHTFYFAVDLNPNGAIDEDSLTFDRVVVTVP